MLPAQSRGAGRRVEEGTLVPVRADGRHPFPGWAPASPGHSSVPARRPGPRRGSCSITPRGGAVTSRLHPAAWSRRASLKRRVGCASAPLGTTRLYRQNAGAEGTMTLWGQLSEEKKKNTRNILFFMKALAGACKCSLYPHPHFKGNEYIFVSSVVGNLSIYR